MVIKIEAPLFQAYFFCRKYVKGGRQFYNIRQFAYALIPGRQNELHDYISFIKIIRL